METIIIQAESKKAKALKQFLKAFDVAFKVEQTAKVEEESPYDPEFVKKIVERTESVRKGNTVEYTSELRKELFGK